MRARRLKPARLSVASLPVTYGHSPSGSHPSCLQGVGFAHPRRPSVGAPGSPARGTQPPAQHGVGVSGLRPRQCRPWRQGALAARRFVSTRIFSPRRLTKFRRFLIS